VEVGQSAKCPSYREQVAFLDLKSKADETPDMKQAKTKMYSLFIGHIGLPGLEMDWKDFAFRTLEPDETQHEPEELRYENTQEYLESMERLT
jgi:hypothetical protein